MILIIPFVCMTVSQDGFLTLSEMLEKLDYIKTSTITDYGAMTFEGHDEL